MPFSLISATVLRTRPIGFTTDYCPVCRSQRRFKLSQAEHRRYFMCLDRGRHGLPHHELTCTQCDARVERPTEERPVTILPDPKRVTSYEPESLPIVNTRIETCSALERILQEGKLSDDQRAEMIRHALFGFAKIYDEETFERLTPIARLFIAFIIITVGASGYYASTIAETNTPIYLAIVAIAVIFFAVFYWAFRHSPRKRVRTWLAKSLVPLDPSHDEIRRIRAELQRSRLKAGFQIRSDKVIAKIKRLKKQGFTGHTD